MSGLLSGVWLRRGFYAAVPIVILLCLSIILVAGTRSGSRWLVYELIDRTDQALSIGSVEGTLLSGLMLQDVHYNNTIVTASIRNAVFRWRAITLFAGRLSITSVEAEGIQFELRTASDSKSESNTAGFSMPFVLGFSDVHLHDLQITINGSPWQLREVTLEGHLGSDELTLKQFSLAESDLSLSLRGSVAVRPPYALQAVTDWHYTPDKKTTYSGQLRAQGDIDRIVVEHELQLPLIVTTTGEIVPGETPHAILKSSSQAMQWPLESAQPLVKTDAVTATVKGWLDNYSIVVDANFSGESLPVSQLRGQATGNLEYIDIVSLLVTSADDTLNAKARGKITFAPEPVIDADIEASMGRNSLVLRGRINRSTDLAWQIRAPLLGDIWPQLTGKLEGHGRIQGAWPEPIMTGELSGNRFSYENYSLGSFKIHAKTLSLNTAGNSQLAFSAQHIRFGGETIEQFDLKLNGNYKRHQVQVMVVNNKVSFNGSLDGAYRDGIWDGQLTNSNLTSNWFGDWVSSAPAKIRISSSEINVERSCWRQNSAALCLQNQWHRASGIAAAADLRALPLEIFNKLLPQNNRLRGLLDAKLTASGALQDLQVNIDANAPNGAILIALDNSEYEDHGWRELSLHATAKANDWQIKTAMMLEQPGYINAELTISPQRVLSGRLNAELENIAWMGLFTPQLRNLDGQIKLSSQIGGTLKQPEYELKASLHNGYAEIPELGIAIRDIELQAHSIDKQRLELNGVLHSGDGKITLNGELIDPLLDSLRLDLRITGQDFEVANLPAVHGIVSPELSMQVNAGQLNMTGTILLPKTHIEIKTLPAAAVSVSGDAVVISSDKTIITNNDRFNIVSNIQLVLGEDVRFQGFGFDTSLEGTLNISEKPDQPVQAYGELRVREGRYKAYGQKLKIESGKLIFRGPYDNPALAIRAVRQATDVTAGLDIGGTLKNPRSRLFSSPALPESEAMAILITGKPMSSASEADAGMLLQAIVSLGVEQGPAITGQLARIFKLDVVTIDSESDLQQSSLLLGKYLTPRLYLKYAVGLFDQSNSVGLEYKLNDNFKLEAQSGTQQSMDLIYRIER